MTKVFVFPYKETIGYIIWVMINTTETGSFQKYFLPMIYQCQSQY